MAVWRELRRIGALSLGQGVWAVPDVAVFADGIAPAKFTLAELEEEEQSLERLRRWHRDLTARDVVGAPEATEADRRLKQCAAACEDYAGRVFTALRRTPEPEQ